MRSGSSEAVEISEQTPQGPLYYEVSVQPILDPGRHAVGQFAISRDITSRRLAEEALKQRTAELEAANQRLQILDRVKDEFVSNLSHELRTPLTSVQIYLDLLEAAPQNRAAYMPTLQREVERLRNMIESLLTLSRLDQRNTSLDFQPVDLVHLVQEYVSDRVHIARNKGLELSFQPGANTVQIDADLSLIGQVVSILLTNATNYTPSGGHVTVGVLPANSPAGWAGFYVSDTGPGLQPEEQERLFTRFFRGKTGRASNISGTGLGLALAKEIIDRHHGRIEVVSSGIPGEGAVFTVWLPAAQPHPDSLLDG